MYPKIICISKLRIINKSINSNHILLNPNCQGPNTNIPKDTLNLALYPDLIGLIINLYDYSPNVLVLPQFPKMLV